MTMCAYYRMQRVHFSNHRIERILKARRAYFASTIRTMGRRFENTLENESITVIGKESVYRRRSADAFPSFRFKNRCCSKDSVANPRHTKAERDSASEPLSSLCLCVSHDTERKTKPKVELVRRARHSTTRHMGVVCARLNRYPCRTYPAAPHSFTYPRRSLHCHRRRRRRCQLAVSRRQTRPLLRLPTGEPTDTAQSVAPAEPYAILRRVATFRFTLFAMHARLLCSTPDVKTEGSL